MKNLFRFFPFVLFGFCLVFNSCSENDEMNSSETITLLKSSNLYEVIQNNLYQILIDAENLEFSNTDPSESEINNAVFTLFHGRLYENTENIEQVFYDEAINTLSIGEINGWNISNTEKEFVKDLYTFYENDDLDGFVAFFKNNKITLLNQLNLLPSESYERFMPVLASINGVIDYYDLRAFQKRNCGRAAVKDAAWGALLGAARGFARGCITGVFLGFNPGSVAAGCMGGMIVGMVQGAVYGAIEGGIRCELGG